MSSYANSSYLKKIKKYGVPIDLVCVFAVLLVLSVHPRLNVENCVFMQDTSICEKSIMGLIILNTKLFYIQYNYAKLYTSIFFRIIKRKLNKMLKLSKIVVIQLIFYFSVQITDFVTLLLTYLLEPASAPAFSCLHQNILI